MALTENELILPGTCDFFAIYVSPVSLLSPVSLVSTVSPVSPVSLVSPVSPVPSSFYTIEWPSNAVQIHNFCPGEES